MPQSDPDSTRTYDALDDPRIADALAEYQSEIDAGHRPDLSAFLLRHAAIAEALEGCLRGLDFVNRAIRKPVTSLATQAKQWPLECDGVVGDFRIIREIGRGGMGVVYEAQQLSLNRRVALKVLPASAALDERSLHRFRHEAQAAAALQHPNIVPVYAVGSAGSLHYFAMQMIDGCSLTDVVRTLRAAIPGSSRAGEPTSAIGAAGSTDLDGPAAKPVAASGAAADPGSTLWDSSIARTPAHYRVVAQLIAQAADALQHAHEFGVIHRDIKSSNLLLDRTGNLWVADFGLAKLPGSDLTGTSDLIGTLRYMSPEQASGQAASFDGRVDVYSLGATLYELLTLESAFTAEDRRALLRKVIEEEPLPPRKHQRTIPADLETITLKAMAKEPGERYASAGAFADDLRRFLEDRPIEAQPPTRMQRSRKWVKRNRILIGVTCGVALVALIASMGVLIASNAAIDAKRRDAEDAREETTRAMLAETEAKEDAKQRLAAEQTARAAERRMVYLQSVALAYSEWQAGNVERALALLNGCPEEYRQWEWGYIRSICTSEVFRLSLPKRFGIRGLGVTSDGKKLAALLLGDTPWTWSLDDGRDLGPLIPGERVQIGPLIGPSAMDPIDGSWWFAFRPVHMGEQGFEIKSTVLLSPNPSRIMVFGPGSPKGTFLDPTHSNIIHALSISTDGTIAASGDAMGMCSVWEVLTRSLSEKNVSPYSSVTLTP